MYSIDGELTVMRIGGTMPASSEKPPRRRILGALPALGAVIALRSPSASAAGKKTVRIAEFDPSGQRTAVTEVERIDKPVAEWKKQLTAEQFAVTRQAATEAPGSGRYANYHG